METRPHKRPGPHPWDLMAHDLLAKPLPTPIPETAIKLNEFTEQIRIHDGHITPARRIVKHLVQPNPQSGNRRGKRT